MNLRSIANSIITSVNPNIKAIWRRSNGYVTGSDGKRAPAYIDTNVEIQTQALSANTLEFVQGLNIQGVMRLVYMYGNAQGIVKPDERGGDILIFPQTQGQPAQKWKIVTVVETWPDWSHVVVVLQ